MIYGASPKQELEYLKEQIGKYSKEESDKRNEASRMQEIQNLIISNTELATKTKAVYVDGNLHYIPVNEAKRLGLLS